MSECRPRSKKLGQHFLIQSDIAIRTAKLVCERNYRRVLELGIGLGSFTRYLLNCADVVGIELDNRIAYCAWRSLAAFNLEVVNADMLKLPLRISKFDVIFGSIPFSLTKPILEMLVKEYQGPALLILQKEVVDRLLAEPGTRSYGRISVFVNLVYKVTGLDIIPPSAFKPPPRVFSQIVLLEPKKKTPKNKIIFVEKFTACLFAQRRRRAIKVITSCASKLGALISTDKLSHHLMEKRVYELSPGEIEEIVESLRLRG